MYIGLNTSYSYINKIKCPQFLEHFSYTRTYRKEKRCLHFCNTLVGQAFFLSNEN